MLAVIVHIEAVPGREEDLIAALKANAAGSRAEPGCRCWEWSRHIENPRRFAIYELYDNAEVFAEHKASDHFAEWTKATEGVMAHKEASRFEVSDADFRR